MSQTTPMSLVLAGTIVLLTSQSSIGQDAGPVEKQDPLVTYFVIHFTKDAPEIGMIGGTFSKRAAAMERAAKIMSNPDVVKVEVSSTDLQQGGFSLAKDGKGKKGARVALPRLARDQEGSQGEGAGENRQ